MKEDRLLKWTDENYILYQRDSAERLKYIEEFENSKDLNTKKRKKAKVSMNQKKPEKNLVKKQMNEPEKKQVKIQMNEPEKKQVKKQMNEPEKKRVKIQIKEPEINEQKKPLDAEEKKKNQDNIEKKTKQDKIEKKKQDEEVKIKKAKVYMKQKEPEKKLVKKQMNEPGNNEPEKTLDVEEKKKNQDKIEKPKQDTIKTLEKEPEKEMSPLSSLNVPHSTFRLPSTSSGSMNLQLPKKPLTGHVELKKFPSSFPSSSTSEHIFGIPKSKINADVLLDKNSPCNLTCFPYFKIARKKIVAKTSPYCFKINRQTNEDILARIGTMPLFHPYPLPRLHKSAPFNISRQQIQSTSQSTVNNSNSSSEQLQSNMPGNSSSQQ